MMITITIAVLLLHIREVIAIITIVIIKILDLLIMTVRTVMIVIDTKNVSICISSKRKPMAPGAAKAPKAINPS